MPGGQAHLAARRRSPMGGKPKIVMAGAGLGGLAAALSLLRRGFDVEVYEQA